MPREGRGSEADTTAGMHRVLVAEILIELALAALVVMGAGSKINAPFHVMQTGLPAGGKRS